ncbi:MAG: hypothetical protein ACRCWG_13320 [Sarcina sp.]
MGVYKIIYDKESNKIYEGEFEGEVREGRGSLYYPSGTIKYLGEWKNDNPDGTGVLFYESGVKFYEGNWVRGSACGQGILFTEKERKEYEGQFIQSKKNGVGIIYYDDGASYQGEWKDDRREGFGTLFYKTGEIHYRGTWENSKKSGDGMLLNEGNKLLYQGEFLEDEKNGLGRSYYSNGNVEYDGQWKNNERSGVGTIYGLDGEKIFEGLFENGKRVVNNQQHNGYETEHTKEKSLKELGIDVSVFDQTGESLLEVDDSVKYKFLNEKQGSENIFNIKNNNYEDFQTEDIIYNKEAESFKETINEVKIEKKYKDDLRNSFVNELDIGEESMGDNSVVINNETDVDEEYAIESVKDDVEFADELEVSESKGDEIEEDSNYKEVVQIVLNEDDTVKGIIEATEKTKESEDGNKKKVTKEVEVEEEVISKNIQTVAKREAQQTQLVEKSAEKTKLEAIKQEEIVEVRIENNRVYKYIEIEDFIYKGEFNEGDKTGNARVYYKNSLKYEGYLSDGIYDGEGKLYDAGERLEYKGKFKDGRRSGYGISYDSVGNAIYKGQWKNDLQEGEGELLNSNGERIYKGMFYKGKALGLGISIENEIDNILYCELESMIGLEEVKDEVARLVSFLKMQILRERVSYKIMDIPYVFTFEGNIGVGKEEVARILGKLYYTLGLIPEYNFLQRDLLTALEYSHDGDIEKSMDNFGGGVLYLNNLYQNNYDDINEVIKNKVSTENVLDLVDYSNGHFIIIFSGDEELIETMIHNKKELAKCVGKSISFFDYSIDEMMDYVLTLSKEKDYILASDLVAELQNYFAELLDNDKFNNRNGEFINEVFTELVKEQCIRIDTYGVSNIENLKIVELQDFKNIENKICF